MYVGEIVVHVHGDWLYSSASICACHPLLHSDFLQKQSEGVHDKKRGATRLNAESSALAPDLCFHPNLSSPPTVGYCRHVWTQITKLTIQFS